MERERREVEQQIKEERKSVPQRKKKRERGEERKLGGPDLSWCARLTSTLVTLQFETALLLD